MWMGGTIPLGYALQDRKLVVNDAEAETFRLIFRRYLSSSARVGFRGVRSKQRILTSSQIVG